MSFFPWNKSNKKNKEKNKEKSGDIGKFFISYKTQARGIANFFLLDIIRIYSILICIKYKS